MNGVSILSFWSNLRCCKCYFLTLTTKKSQSLRFFDFKPTSLCNYVYKIISKLIDNRIKNIISLHILPEKFVFLSDRKIQDVVTISQESIHSIKICKSKDYLMKNYLSKAYDHMDWDFLHLFLPTIGFPHRHARLIMAYVTSTLVAVLINGLPIDFFKISRGLRQGCELSPLLFIIFMDSLNKKIREVKSTRVISSCRVSTNYSSAHILFIDDVL